VRYGDLKRSKESESLWDTRIRPQLENRAASLSVDRATGKSINIDEELENRIRAACKMLPHPNDPDEPVTVADIEDKSIANEPLSQTAESLIFSSFRKKLLNADIGRSS